jgi:hypothetical protein
VNAILKKTINGVSITSDSNYTELLKPYLCFCTACCYWFTHQGKDLHDFYANDYTLLMQNFRTDQILFNKSPQLGRAEYQALIIQNVAKSFRKPHLLEVGAGKGLTAFYIDRLVDTQGFSLHDPGAARYSSTWSREVNPTSIHSSLEDLSSIDFDLGFSFFSLEHSERPVEDMVQIARSMRKSSVFLGAVPWLCANPGDLLVGDHCSHFTYASLCRLLERNRQTQGIEYRVLINTALRALIYICSHSSAHLDNAVTTLLSGVLAKDFTGTMSVKELSDDDLFAFAQRQWWVDVNVTGKKQEVLWGAGFYSKLIMLRHHSTRFSVCIDSNPDLVDTNFVDPNNLALKVEASETWLENCSSENRLWLGMSASAREKILMVHHTVLTKAGVQIAF